MLRSAARYLVHHSSQFGRVGCQAPRMCLSTIPHIEGRSPVTSKFIEEQNRFGHKLGEKITWKERMSILIKTLYTLENSKDAIYDTLDAWVAWEKKFPIATLKLVLLDLEKDQQWHRIIQVIKWMLSKGQGNTMGTYEQLIRALDKDYRAEEAHNIWMKKIGNNLHSVPWDVCHLMISVYHRNNMLERLVKLFGSLEAFDRVPSDKSIVQKVVDAYELLGLVDEKERLLEKYADLLNKTHEHSKMKSNKTKSRKKKFSCEESKMVSNKAKLRKKKVFSGSKSSLANGVKS